MSQEAEGVGARPKTKNTFGVVLIIGLVLIGGSLLAWKLLASPADEYQYGAPPAGANARPDPPNPEKLKRLPGGKAP